MVTRRRREFRGVLGFGASRVCDFECVCPVVGTPGCHPEGAARPPLGVAEPMSPSSPRGGLESPFLHFPTRPPNVAPNYFSHLNLIGL